MAGLEAAYGDSTWVDLERIRDEVYDPSTPIEDSRRFYLNQITAAVDGWLSEPEIDAVVDSTRPVAEGETVVLGFDGSRKRTRGVTDATALIGCRVSDGHLFQIAVWEQPEGPAGDGWQVPRTEVDAVVRDTIERFTVVGMFADPAKWESYVGGWEAAFGGTLQVRATKAHPIEWWMTGGRSGLIVRVTEQLHTAIVEREVTFDGAVALRRHLLNARRRLGKTGVQIAKEHPESARKIDAAVAAILAFACRQEAVAAGVTGDVAPHDGRAWAF